MGRQLGEAFKEAVKVEGVPCNQIVQTNLLSQCRVVHHSQVIVTEVKVDGLEAHAFHGQRRVLINL